MEGHDYMRLTAAKCDVSNITIHSNTNNTSSIELLNRLSNKHKIVTENMHDSTYNTARHI
jgi:hypothetical protein